MNIRLISRLALSAALLLALVPSASAEDDDRKARLEEMKRQAAEYKLILNNGSSTALKLHDEPLLRFDNPVGGVPDGIAVMWKDGQRPAVIAQVFQTAEGVWVHEVQSLARAGLSMEFGGAAKWKPEKAADDFRALAKDAAADIPTKRLVQMKKLAAEFTAADDFKVRSTDKETTRHELRLLPTPVYRYSDGDAGIDDGAVFAFVHGTDPELFLVLEHRTNKNKELGWHYALIPMTCWAVEARHDKKMVWSVPERLGKSKPTDAYHVWIHKPN
jgi:hypothetical protein